MTTRRYSSEEYILRVVSYVLIPNESMTLSTYLHEELRKSTIPCEELCQLFDSLQIIAKSISFALSRFGIFKMYDSENPYPTYRLEDSEERENIMNSIFTDILSSSHSTCLLVNQGSKEIIEVKPEKRGKYIVCFNSLDESNISAYGSVGSTFAVYKKLSEGEPSISDVLQPGKNVVGAGYIVYSSATVMVVSIGKGVHEFTLNPSVGEFVLTDKNVRIPSKGETYSVNEGFMYQWPDGVAGYVESKKERETKKPYDAKYVGSITGDLHRTLKDGGIVIYPTTHKHPKGQLCLLYECIPLAFIISQAGGMASNGKMSILEIVPESLHQKSQMFVGSKEDVKDMLAFIKLSIQNRDHVGETSKSK